MVLKTFDTILTELCDTFDKEIAPSKIARTNSNIFYLLHKSWAKGLEVINNVVVALRNKFDPANCEDEDLISIAKLVGTSRYEGSSSGLQITITNTGNKAIVIHKGIYEYQLNDEDIFRYTNNTEFDIPNGKNNKKVVIAMSTTRKAIHVTEQPSIKVSYFEMDAEGKPTVEKPIENGNFLEFSCADNIGLQGVLPESTLAFRERVLQGASTATLYDKMETEIRNLPYIFSCNLKYNNSIGPAVVGKITIDPYKLLVVINGTPDAHVAEIIASYGISETQAQEGVSKQLEYVNDIFTDGGYIVNYFEPEIYTYGLDIYYEADPKAISDTIIKDSFEEALQKFKITNEYNPLITERDFSTLLVNLGLSTVQILDVDIKNSEGTLVDYLKVPVTEIARLGDITFHNMTQA